ncbi:translocation/assembly module TamB domain-containing protein [Rhizobium paknamense]|uniref:Translocation and assembly module TamB n=1 Tax=Rhizobium paknamense TaxID=1206817 RepID=A0ABU0IH94_9HYPH|nr:translocation/assembly module TamB domain-containing protein [Rhizobium paknamense]MDQ0456594.1 translocation and assembly module TamB [Rhizobium paknamense]
MRFLTATTRFALYGLLILLGMLVIGLALAGGTRAGGQMVADFAASILSKPNRMIEIDDPSGLMSGEWKVARITLSDQKGPYLDIRDVFIDWSPLALLSRRVEAQSVAARSITLLRKPLQDAEQTEKQTSNNTGFSLPVTIDVARLDVPSLKLGKEVMGTEAELALAGRVLARTQGIDSDLSLSRARVPDAKLNASLIYDPNANRLDIDARLQEPKDGILAKLVQIPGAPPVTISLSGQGPIDDWKASARAALDGQPRLAVDLTHRVMAEGRAVSLKGAGDFADLVPPDLRGLFAGSTSIDLAALISEQGSITIQRGSVETDSLSLTAGGRYDPQGDNDLSVKLTGKQGPVALRWPLAEGTLSAALQQVDLSIAGQASTAKIKAHAALAELSLPQGKLSGLALDASSDAFNLTDRAGTLQSALTVETTALADDNLQRAFTAPLKITAPVTLSREKITTDRLDIASQTLKATARAAYDLASKAATASITTTLDPQALPAQMGQKLEGPVSLEAEIASAGSNLSIPSFSVTSSLIDSTGQMQLENNTLSAKLEGRIKQLAKLTPQASGSGRFSVDATGPMDHLAATGTFTIDEAMMAGRRLNGFALTAKADLKRGAPSASLSATGSLDGKPVTAALDLASKDGRTSIPKLTLDVGPNHLDGTMMLSGAMLPSGEIRFRFPDLGLLAALGGQTASGDLAGDVTLKENAGRIAATIQASGKSLRSGTVEVDAPDIDVSTPDLAALAIDGRAKAGRVSTGSALLENPALTFTRRGSRTDIALGGRYDGAPLTGSVLVQQDVDTLLVKLNSFSAVPRGIAVKLNEPTTIRVEDGTAFIDGLTLTAGGGSVSLKGEAGKTLDLQAVIRALPASLANSFSAGLDAGGTIAGTIDAKGTSSAPQVTYDLSWRDATVAQLKAAGLTPLAITAKGDFRNQRLGVQTTVSGGGLNVTGGGGLTLTGTRPIDMSFDLRLPFQALQGLLSAQGLVLEGQANGSIKVAGTLSSPQLSGGISTNGARLIDVQRNLALEGLSADIRLEGKRATLASLNGRLSTGGRISANGSVDLAGEGMPADLSVQLQNAVYVNGDLVTATGNGTLSLKGPLKAGPTLSGKLTLEKTSITIPAKLPSSIAELNIKHKNAPKDVRRQMQALSPNDARASSSPIKLDLQISAPSQIFVRGRGIDAELNGDVAVRGTAAEPQVAGGFTLKRGRIVILTKRLDFSEGKITFGGGLIPLVDFTASSTSGSTTLNATVEGMANDPQIGFSSSPALPQDEILAQLIFGQSLSKLSPLQIAQLADAVGQLAGGRSTSLFNSLRNSVGVDDLDISTDSKGDAQVSAGKYLNDKTYLEFQQSSTGSRAVINLDVGRGVKLKGQAGANGDSGGGIYYEKEY